MIKTTSKDKPKESQEGQKENNLLAIDLRNQVESSLDVDENIVCTSVQKEVKLSILHHKEEKEMPNLFHIKI
jgi:hypothetical protein